VESLTSVYELTTPFGKERKQRFWDYFDGDALRSWWNTSGTATISMDDTVNSGVKIVTTSTSGSSGTIDTNTINHYSNTGHVIISRWKSDSATNIDYIVGLATRTGATNRAYIILENSPNAIDLATRDGSTYSSVSFISSPDANWHNFKQQMTSTNFRGYMDGNFEAVKTNNLPADKIGMLISYTTQENVSHTGNISYYEAYNT
jgi:hypothetical protein